MAVHRSRQHNTAVKRKEYRATKHGELAFARRARGRAATSAECPTANIGNVFDVAFAASTIVYTCTCFCFFHRTKSFFVATATTACCT